ncbi:MAG: hypothetical protein MAG551_00724 [Candidatus Scalindua arabica]|uniref:BON domain-containing protein n=1 Tax=Candidatus Scalindua arabica TaxID=1127984 RepID=A0A941W1T9_9BACT|nr:hypothetical protein [Candidatus Scalindua arabica]
MKTIKKLTILVAILLIVAASTLFGINNMTDRDINDWVRYALRHDEHVDASKITVSTKNRIVTLSGKTDNLATKSYADKEAKKINGVLGVINKIIVLPIRRSDTDIRHEVQRRILNSAVIESERLNVTSVDGKVTLSGEVSTSTEALEAVLLTSEVRGVKEVKNNLTPHWKNERSDDEIKNDVVATLERDVYLGDLPITVSVNKGVVTLTGLVGSAYEKDLAKSDISCISNVKVIKNDLKVRLFLNRGSRKKNPNPSDDELKKSVLAVLSQDTRVNVSGITVRVTSGHVILGGSVKNSYEKDIVEKDTKDVVGVGFVTNNLVCTRGNQNRQVYPGRR